jgi:hypothetical protein
MKSLLLLCTLVLSANSFAATMECYKRSYSKTYLRNNPQHGVTYIDLTIVKVDDVIEAHSSLVIKEYDRGYHLSTGCEAVRGALSCVDTEAGVNLKITIKNKKTARIEVVQNTTWAEAESDMTVTIFPPSATPLHFTRSTFAPRPLNFASRSS